MKPGTVSLLLLMLLGVAWRGDSHSWVGTRGSGWRGDPKMGRKKGFGQLSSDGRGVQGRMLRGIRRSGGCWRPEQLGLGENEQVHCVI